MPPIERAHRKDPVVVWEKIRVNDQNEPIVGEPSEIKVRFQHRRIETISPDGTPILIEALITPTYEIPIDSIIWKGTMQEYGLLNLNEQQEYWQVVIHNIATDVKGRSTRYQFGLRRFRGSLPEVGT